MFGWWVVVAGWILFGCSLYGVFVRWWFVRRHVFGFFFLFFFGVCLRLSGLEAFYGILGLRSAIRCFFSYGLESLNGLYLYNKG